jgi:hypothetical protein
MSLRRLIVLASGLALGSVAVAWAVSEASNSFVLPVVPYIQVGRMGAAAFFVLAPAAATLAFGLAWRQSWVRLVGASALSAALVVLVSWATWIGAIIVYCGVLSHSCFD